MDFIGKIAGAITSVLGGNASSLVGVVGNMVFPEHYFIGTVALDTVTDEDHNYEAEPTAYPVENGVEMNDHINIKPAKVKIKGEVSDLEGMDMANSGIIMHPMAMLDTLKTSILGGGGAMKKSNMVWEQLRAVQTNRETLTVATNLSIYEDMYIVGLRTHQNTDTAGTLRFEATLAEVPTIDFASRSNSPTLSVPESKQTTNTAKTQKDTVDRANSSRGSSQGSKKSNVAKSTSSQPQEQSTLKAVGSGLAKLF